MKKNKTKRRTAIKKQKIEVFKEANEEIRLNICMAVALIQMMIHWKYNRMQEATKIIKYINGEYVENCRKEGKEQLDYDCLVLAHSYFKYKYHNDFNENKILEIYNRKQKTSFTNLKDCLLNELNKLDNNKFAIVENIIYGKK